jgi:hypothetical protein
MALHGNRPSIVHPAGSANLTGYTYYEVYSGTGGGTATINGTAMTIPAASSIPIIIKSISGVTGDIYVLGDPINVSYGSNIIGGSFTS